MTRPASHGYLTTARWLLTLLLFLCLHGHANAATEEIRVFTREGCPRCSDAKRFLSALRASRPGLVITELDVGSDPAALAQLRTLAGERGLAAFAVPTFVIGDEVLVGFQSAETSGARLVELLGSGARSPPAVVPVFGPVDVGRLGLPLFTVALGLVDGFNPCAMWVLLFILSLLVNLRDRTRMAIIAGTFVAVSGVVYFAFMAAWLQIFLLVGVGRTVHVALGILAVVIALVNLKDFVAFGYGPSLVIPQAAKPTIYAHARRVLSAENLRAALAATVILALLVNTVELLCTSGLPALYTRILTLRELAAWQYYAYLGLYNLAYVADDAMMVTIAVVTLSRLKLQERGGRYLKLVSGVVMLALGILLLVQPDWLA